MFEKDEMEDRVGWAEEEYSVICRISRWEKEMLITPTFKRLLFTKGHF